MKTNHKLISIAASVLLSACITSKDNKDFEPIINEPEVPEPIVEIDSSSRIFLFGSDYSTGEISQVDLESTALNNSIVFYQDSRVYSDGENLWVLEGLGADNLVKLPIDYTSSDDIIFQKSLDDNSNPVDIAFSSESRAWVSLENTNTIIQINTEDGEKVSEYDLSQYAFDADNFANPGDLLISGDTLFVAIQRRNGFSAGDLGVILLLDANSGDSLGTINLPMTNPTSMTLVEGNLYVSLSGEFFTGADSSRALVSVDLSDLTPSIITYDTDLGGSPTAIQSLNNQLYVKIQSGYDDSFNAIESIVQMDPSTEVVTEVYSGSVEGGFAYSQTDEAWIIGSRAAGNEGLVILKEGSESLIQFEDALAPYSIQVVNY